MRITGKCTVKATVPGGTKWLLVKNEKGIIHYLRKNPPVNVSFNLVKSGTYTANVLLAGVMVLPIQIRSVSQQMPTFERGRYKPGMDLQISFNPDIESPARIFTGTGKIEVNRAFTKMPYPFQRFILYHELAHLFYGTEWKCDTFALIMCMKEGLNPSNCLYALTRVLKRSPENARRAQIMAMKTRRK